MTIVERYGIGTLVLAVFSSGAPAASGPDPIVAAGLSLEPTVYETRSGNTVEAELGRLSVPEDRSDPDPRAIELVFIRLPSTAGSPGPPIVYLAGGPGGSGIRAGRGDRFALFDALRAAGDVILLDQRGTGMSTPIEPEECPVSRELPADRPIELDSALALAEEVGEACGRFWREEGVALDAYTTADSVEDLEALRRALGVEQIDLLGISYGTHLALAFTKRYPERVRRAVLAGIEGPDHTVKLPSRFETQLDRLEALLPADEREVRERLEGVLTRLEREPVSLRIREVEGPDTERLLVVGRREVAEAVLDLLRDPRGMIRVPALAERMAAGDFTDLAGTLAGMRSIGGLEAMPEAMDAASGISRERLEQLEREDETTLLGSGMIQTNVAIARGLGVRDLGPDFRAPVVSDVPTLFVSGSLDGRTPASNAREVMAGFPGGRHLVVRNGGHGDDLLVATPKLRDAIAGHFLGREADLEEVVVPPPDLTGIRRRVPLEPEEAGRYVGEYERRPREIWRILHHTTVESLGETGEPTARNAVLQIRWNGDGFPFHPESETRFFIDFPWFADVDFVFELDPEGRVTHLVFEDADGKTVRMEKIH